MNIGKLEPIAEAMAIVLRTNVGVSRCYHHKATPVIKLEVGENPAFTYQALGGESGVQQNYTLCCYLIALMDNLEAQPFSKYQEAIKQITNEDLFDWPWPFENLSIWKVAKLLIPIIGLLCQKKGTSRLQVDYWEEINRWQSTPNGTECLVKKTLSKLKFSHLPVFEMDISDNGKAIDAMNDCLDVVLGAIGEAYLLMAHEVTNKELANSRQSPSSSGPRR